MPQATWVQQWLEGLWLSWTTIQYLSFPISRPVLVSLPKDLMHSQVATFVVCSPCPSLWPWSWPNACLFGSNVMQVVVKVLIITYIFIIINHHEIILSYPYLITVTYFENAIVGVTHHLAWGSQTHTHDFHHITDLLRGRFQQRNGASPNVIW